MRTPAHCHALVGGGPLPSSAYHGRQSRQRAGRGRPGWEPAFRDGTCAESAYHGPCASQSGHLDSAIRALASGGRQSLAVAQSLPRPRGFELFLSAVVLVITLMEAPRKVRHLVRGDQQEPFVWTRTTYVACSAKSGPVTCAVGGNARCRWCHAAT